MLRRAPVFPLAGLVAASLALSAKAEPAPMAGDPAQFLDKVEADLAAAEIFANRADWVYQTNITPDTEWLRTKVSSEAEKQAAEYARQSARYNSVATDATTRRKIELLQRTMTLPPSSKVGAAEQIASITAGLTGKFAANVVHYRGEDQTYDTLNDLLGRSRDPVETSFLWQAWRAHLPEMRQDYSRLIALANEGARELGYGDAGALWRSQYDMPEAEFGAMIERLWSQVEPLFKNLHCYVRAKLNDAYGASVQPRTGAIRADLLGHLSAWKWNRIYGVVAPSGDQTSYDLTVLLAQNGYDAEKIVRTAESFYASLGFDPLPDTFWQRSMLVAPSDLARKVVCHPSAWDIDARDDLRLKACFKGDAYAFETAHHEIGHNIYQRAYKDQPYLFRAGANDGFHEAIGDFIALYAATPTYLKQIGLLSDVPDSAIDIPELLRSALAHVAVLPFAILVDKWRWRVFSGETTPASYNSDWWSLARRYQGVVPPVERSVDGFDPGAHYHIPASVPYTRYFLAEIFEFQFFRAACRQAGWTGPLNRCSIFGDKSVGRKLNSMLQLGASKPWRVALEAFTGETDADAGAILEYYGPLDRWLNEQNKGEVCGW